MDSVGGNCGRIHCPEREFADRIGCIVFRNEIGTQKTIECYGKIVVAGPVHQIGHFKFLAMTIECIRFELNELIYAPGRGGGGMQSSRKGLWTALP
jgi:hypothetical protein